MLGYDVQVLEFIDLEHTPKNILIRAVKNKHAPPKQDKQGDKIKHAYERYSKFSQLLSINPSLWQRMKDLCAC
ncbi:MAG: hypothetical protein H0X29_06470 [Parachlamydiaceae bacterium]|nr:hypothetical protein [Parachlamydiaceae bacterium]